jgi:hypothetical protein
MVEVDDSTSFGLAADAILLVHALFVAFVVLGLLAIFIGYAAGWSWVRNRWFRLLHLAAIAVVVIQAWLGRLCPLTLLEMELRRKAGDVDYPGSFIAHWVEAVLYYDAPGWVFVAAYTVFGTAVAASWYWLRPRPF